MTSRIDWNAKIAIAGGPELSFSKSLDVEAYDVVSATVDDGATAAEVELVPGVTDSVKFLAITASAYDDDVKYVVNSGDPVTNGVELNQPHIFAGAGAITVLAGSSVPGSLIFANSSGAAVVLQILVGRDATPGP